MYLRSLLGKDLLETIIYLPRPAFPRLVLFRKPSMEAQRRDQNLPGHYVQIIGETQRNPVSTERQSDEDDCLRIRQNAYKRSLICSED